MDFLRSVQQQAQQAAEKLMSSEAADKARQLAQQASKQATALAAEATAKAQEVAREALGEAEKSIATLRSKPAAPNADPLAYGITPELQQFVRSLTYSTFSDYPLDSLELPADPAQQRLSGWQETHARLLLQQVPQLQDLRFVLCPRRMDEYTFWMVYFTLSKRYLPQQQDEQQQLEQLEQQQQQRQQQPGAAAAAAAAVAAGAAGAAAAAGLPQSSSAARLTRSIEGDDGLPAAAQEPQLAYTSDAGAAAAAAGEPHSSGGDAAAGPAAAVDDELAELADDPELDAYLQDALQLDGDVGSGSGGLDGADSDLDDLDDYINKLAA